MEQKINVLLVDDETDFVDSVEFWLNSKGYAVSVANNGEEAMRIIKKKLPHIVFLDINMPVMDGIQTLTRIRELSRQLPVIMLTAYASEEKFLQAQKLKISGFFSKKGSLEELLNIIETTLRIHKGLKK